jgi:hypothetical protein
MIQSHILFWILLRCRKMFVLREAKFIPRTWSRSRCFCFISFISTLNSISWICFNWNSSFSFFFSRECGSLLKISCSMWEKISPRFNGNIHTFVSTSYWGSEAPNYLTFWTPKYYLGKNKILWVSPKFNSNSKFSTFFPCQSIFHFL